MLDTAFVPAAEAAFLAGLSDRQIQRVVDEDILEAPFVQLANGRRFARLGAALASFYFDLDEVLTASARRYAIAQVSRRVLARSDVDALLALDLPAAVMNWDVEFSSFHLGLAKFVIETQGRAVQVEGAHRAIVEDPDILGGVPVFRGSRVPVDTVIAMHRAGSRLDALQADFPFLTADLLAAAEIYQAVHPRRGRPARPGQVPPDWKLRSRKVVRPATREE